MRSDLINRTRACVIIDRVLAAGFGIVATYAAAGTLDSSAFGLWVVYEGVRVAVLTCVDRSVGQAHVTLAAADPEASSGVASAAVALKAASMMLIATFALVALVTPHEGDTIWRSVAIALPGWLLLSMVQTTVQQALNAERAYLQLASSDAIALTALVLGTILLRAEITSAAAMMWLACGARAAGGVCFAYRCRLAPRVAVARVKELLRFARGALVNNLATYLNLRSDGLLLGTVSTLTAAAQWGLVAPLVNAYMLIGEAANLELLPSVAAAAAKGRHDEVRRAVYHELAICTGMAALLSIAVTVLPLHSVLPGEEALRVGAKPMLLLVALAGPCLVIGRIMATVNNGYGRPEHNAHATVVGLVVKVTAGAALIYAFRATGAAAAMVLTSAVVMWLSGYHASSIWRRPCPISTVVEVA